MSHIKCGFFFTYIDSSYRNWFHPYQWTRFIQKSALWDKLSLEYFSGNLLLRIDEKNVNLSYLEMKKLFFFSFSGQPFPLFKGTTNYDFSFDLKPELPSTFVGECGKIKYKLDVIVSKAWSFDEKQTIALNIIQTVNLNCVPAMLQSYQYQQTRNIGGLKPLPLSLHVSLPKRGFIFGDTIPVQVYTSGAKFVIFHELYKICLFAIFRSKSLIKAKLMLRSWNLAFTKSSSIIAKHQKWPSKLRQIVFWKKTWTA